MTSTPFVYSQSLFDACAASEILSLLIDAVGDLEYGRNRTRSGSPLVVSSLPAAPLSKEHITTNKSKHEKDESCVVLWQEYNRHYGGTAWKDGSLVSVDDSDNFERFLRSVYFVNKHNNDPKTWHRVSLNRFSAMETSHIFFQVDIVDAFHRRNLQEDIIMSPDLAIGHGGKHYLHKHHNKKLYNAVQDVPVKEIRVPDVDRKPFQTPVISRQLDGFLLSVKKRHLKREQPQSPYNDKNSVADAVPSPDRYKTHLNWATTDNPDGVPIVHDAFDQLSCGSCWAITAAGSLEASASRRAAYIAYETFRTSYGDLWQENETIQVEAIAVAQRVQRRAMNVLNLSVQELLDCDSTTDQGCIGGNPLLAFYYIHQNGLASWDDYPYQAIASTCLKNATQNPVATVKSWGIIQSDHEKHMELALRYIGPIAVGINGDSSAFLGYSGGIFDYPDCKQGANHALLIVGYGEEESSDGEKIRYWIARNRQVATVGGLSSPEYVQCRADTFFWRSWGTGWGENGYVRIKRGEGYAGMKGVCGVARNPSVALGGILLRETGYVFNESGLQRLRGFSAERLCSRWNVAENTVCATTTKWVDSHKALMLGVFGVFCGLVLIWPLTMDIRRRREHRRLQKLRREERRRNSSRKLCPTENTPLLTPATEKATS